MTEPHEPDMDVLEALDQGRKPESLPAASIRRLIRRKLIASRYRGRVLLTGVGREMLVRRRHKLRSTPADLPGSDDTPASD